LTVSTPLPTLQYTGRLFGIGIPKQKRGQA
jgi:hypothetical protein